MQVETAINIHPIIATRPIGVLRLIRGAREVGVGYGLVGRRIGSHCLARRDFVGVVPLNRCERFAVPRFPLIRCAFRVNRGADRLRDSP